MNLNRENETAGYRMTGLDWINLLQDARGKVGRREMALWNTETRLENAQRDLKNLKADRKAFEDKVQSLLANRRERIATACLQGLLANGELSREIYNIGQYRKTSSTHIAVTSAIELADSLIGLLEAKDAYEQR